MRQRCGDMKNKNYGAKGVRVCDRWQSFACFLEDMGPKPTPKHEIDRIDPAGNYEPSNCRWATRKEQAYNRRATRLIEYQGRKLTCGQWANELGLSRQTLWSRIYVMGWPVTRAFEKSPDPRLSQIAARRHGKVPKAQTCWRGHPYVTRTFPKRGTISVCLICQRERTRQYSARKLTPPSA